MIHETDAVWTTAVEASSQPPANAPQSWTGPPCRRGAQVANSLTIICDMGHACGV